MSSKYEITASMNLTPPAFQTQFSYPNILFSIFSSGKTVQDSSKPIFNTYSINFNAYKNDTFHFNSLEYLEEEKKNIKTKHPAPTTVGTDSKVDEAVRLKEEYDNLFDKYLNLISERDNLKNENEKLKLLAYKSYDDIKEELDYEISRATEQSDSLLILMELRENKKLTYMELKDKVTLPGSLFIRLSELFNVNLAAVDEKTGEFFITRKGVEFLEKRGL